MKNIAVAACLILIATSYAATAAPARFCPDQITTTQEFEPIDGFSKQKKVGYNPREGMGFSFGNPSFGLELKPAFQQTKNERIYSFLFGDGSKEIWISCGYRGTTIILDKNIGKPKKCTVREDKKTGKQKLDCSY